MSSRKAPASRESTVDFAAELKLLSGRVRALEQLAHASGLSRTVINRDYDFEDRPARHLAVERAVVTR